ncbi:hypothetical protein PUN28_016997 [Cardiocondyla obscurior]|uniref:BED-type domain-containing protein n=1 Tax=Cardiocondyla obscurior TaxID=286306 RepID=A0AAW2EL15_9HYME
MDISKKGAIKKVLGKRIVRNFQTSWLDDKAFKGWLASYHENNAMCTVCNKLIRCCKSDLLRHSQSVKHITNINANAKNCNVESKNDQISHANARCYQFSEIAF